MWFGHCAAIMHTAVQLAYTAESRTPFGAYYVWCASHSQMASDPDGLAAGLVLQPIWGFCRNSTTYWPVGCRQNYSFWTTARLSGSPVIKPARLHLAGRWLRHLVRNSSNSSDLALVRSPLAFQARAHPVESLRLSPLSRSPAWAFSAEKDAAAHT